MVRTIFYIDGLHSERGLLYLPVKIDGSSHQLGKVVRVEHHEGQTKVYVEWALETASTGGSD